MEQILEKLTSNRLKAVLFGAAVTAVIQSSSAATVMVVGITIFLSFRFFSIDILSWISFEIIAVLSIHPLFYDFLYN